MAFSNLDYWKLSDEFSIIDAAILITDNDPSESVDVFDDENGVQVFNADGTLKRAQKTSYNGFDAVFKALRNAVLSNKLKATLGFPARAPSYHYGQDGFSETNHPDDIEIAFDTLLKISDYNTKIFTNKKLSEFKLGEKGSTFGKVYVIAEPDWTQTTAQIDDLREWLDVRGIHPPFFFPKGKAEGFRDKTHRRYSAKLACAIAAWEAVQKAASKKSVKESISEWVQSNGASFGMSDKNGVVPQKAVEEVAKVVNWAIRGGATPTAQVQDDETPEDIQNFDTIYNNEDELPF